MFGGIRWWLEGSKEKLEEGEQTLNKGLLIKYCQAQKWVYPIVFSSPADRERQGSWGDRSSSPKGSKLPASRVELLPMGLEFPILDHQRKKPLGLLGPICWLCPMIYHNGRSTDFYQFLLPHQSVLIHWEMLILRLVGLAWANRYMSQGKKRWKRKATLTHHFLAVAL